MDRDRRTEVLARVPEKVRAACTLADITREYTLEEITIITRAAPARMLGLKHKGHLGPGADADITIYQPQEDLQEMFELPLRDLSRRGAGRQRRNQEVGRRRTHFVAPTYDEACVPDIQKWFEANYSMQFRNYEVGEHYITIR